MDPISLCCKCWCIRRSEDPSEGLHDSSLIGGLELLSDILKIIKGRKNLMHAVRRLQYEQIFTGEASKGVLYQVMLVITCPFIIKLKKL